jgi:23S rRNA U2552 (ribose-2'-O)-methylase RlmE/FtsJ
MKTLNEIYSKYQSPEGHGDKGTAHTYIDEYEKLLKDYRENSTVLEIGICRGESIKMWDEYFINSKVYGVDITDHYIKDLIKENKYNIIIGNACSKEILNQLNNLTFDVIIDDGSHLINDQINSFNILKNRMKSNGIYIIEDVNNLDSTIDTYKKLHNNVEIIDNRHIKNRVDDVLVVYKF